MASSHTTPGRCVVVGAAPISNYERIRMFLQPATDYFIFADGALSHAPGLHVAPDAIVGDFDSIKDGDLHGIITGKNTAFYDLTHDHTSHVSSSPFLDGSTPEPASVSRYSGVDFALNTLSTKGDDAIDQLDTSVTERNHTEHPRPSHREIDVIQLSPMKDVTDTAYAVDEGLRRGFSQFLLVGVLGGRFDHAFSNVQLLPYLHERGARGFIVDDVCELTTVTSTGTVIDSQGFAELSMTPDVVAPSPVRYFSVLATSGEAPHVWISGAKYELSDARLEPTFQLGVSNELIPDTAATITSTSPVIIVAVRKAQPDL